MWLLELCSKVKAGRPACSFIITAYRDTEMMATLANTVCIHLHNVKYKNLSLNIESFTPPKVLHQQQLSLLQWNRL